MNQGYYTTPKGMESNQPSSSSSTDSSYNPDAFSRRGTQTAEQVTGLQMTAELSTWMLLVPLGDLSLRAACEDFHYHHHAAP